jgi:FkbM family methyltransferase
VKRLVFGLVGVAALVAAAIALWSRHDSPLTGVSVVAVPSSVDADVELFATRFGRVLVRSAARARALQFRRHAHEVWLPLGELEAVHSKGGRWERERAPAGLYVPPYAMQAWTGDGALLGFVAAPEDEPTVVAESDARIADAADAVALPSAPGRWMLDKLERVVVEGNRRLGPFDEDAAILVEAGRGELRAGGRRAIAARQLARIEAGRSVEVAADSPLTLLVFEPAHTTVSAILKSGEKRYSQDDEELVIRDFFRDRRGGVFVDVGAGDWQRYSTTLYLEEQLGWSGVAVDALAEYAEGYRQHRQRTRFVNAIVTDRARGPQKFYRADDFPEVSSVSQSLAVAQAREFTDGGAISERVVPTRTLDEVLGGLGVRAIDLLSMDIEEHEPAALAGFDLARFRPAFVCVEAHPAVRDALWHYFVAHRYARQDQYLAWDSANWYFAPR